MSGMGRGTRRVTLFGRRREQEALIELLNHARGGRSGALVVRGDAGMGKTALLSDMLANAADLRAIAVSGAESEMELTYAGVQQLCAPLFGHIDQLPEPQKQALRVALGLRDGDAPDPFLVALAVL